MIAKIMGVARAALWPAYWVSGLLPRDRASWVFGSRDGFAFADNAKWFFLACERDARLNATWLTRSRALARELRARGHRAFHLFSARGIWASIRAGVYVFDSSVGALNVWLSRGARRVNLWHGVPLKRIEADVPRASRHFRYFDRWSARGVMQRVFRPAQSVRAHRLVATSASIGNLLASAFRLPASAVLVTGYPRNDPLYDPELVPSHDRAAMGDAIGNGRHARIVGYFPTFRERATPAAPSEWNWEALQADLAARNALLVVKLHPADSARWKRVEASNIRWLPADLDPYPLLGRLDVLVTDYSSIYVDYLLLERPVVFFAYDVDEYVRSDRAFYFDYDAMTPGPKARTFEELRASLGRVLDRYDDERVAWSAHRRRVLSQCHTHQDGCASLRLADALLSELDVPRGDRPSAGRVG
jgi:CDP-glycerol glycerophosphotransferase (TagB/SpsB family)